VEGRALVLGSEMPLSRREKEILKLTCQGLTDSDIAGQLGITRATVRTHIANLREKLGAGNRAQLGLLAPPFD
jgi:DNA-binding CsgD family transcriptional regulator